MSDIHEEVRDALNKGQDNIPFEELPGEESSPLNQPVVEKESAGTQEPSHEQVAHEQHSKSTARAQDLNREEPHYQQESEPEVEQDYYDDAPEQEIDEDYTEATLLEDEEEFELPPSHAKQAADTVLGMANNVLEVGGGYFVKVRKHKEFYEFEEIIQVIDDQNVKNVKRIKLDDEDKALLRPLLISVLKTKAKKLTPEQQLLGAIISILMKKAQVVMEIRAENDILVERILDIVREEKGYSEQDEDYEEDTGQQHEPDPEPEKQPEPEQEEKEEAVVVEEVVVEEEQQAIPPEQIMEVAGEEPQKEDDKKEEK